MKCLNNKKLGGKKYFGLACELEFKFHCAKNIKINPYFELKLILIKEN